MSSRHVYNFASSPSEIFPIITHLASKYVVAMFPCLCRLAVRPFQLLYRLVRPIAVPGLLLVSMQSYGAACLVENGCLENMTESYGADGHHYPEEKKYQFIFNNEADAVHDLCMELYNWVDLANSSLPEGMSYSAVCPVEGENNGSSLTRYEFPITFTNSRGSTPSQNHTHSLALVGYRSLCETESYTFGLDLPPIMDGNHEQCWRCSSGLRSAKAPTFAQYASDGKAINTNGNTVTWFSPEACPEEFVQNEPCDNTTEGNPVACESGTKILREVDYQAGGNDSLRFTRLYSAQPLTAHQSSPPASAPQWAVAEPLTLTVLRDTSYGRLIEIRQGEPMTSSAGDSGVIQASANMRVYLYIGGGGATRLNSSKPGYGAVKLESEGWTWHTANGGKVVFGAEGKPIRRERRGGLITQYEWQTLPDAPPVLTSMTSETGRQLHFTYNSEGQLTTLTDPAGEEIHYQYDVYGNLIQVIYPDHTPETLVDNPRKQYHYEDLRFDHHLTGITDENGSRLSTYAYDDLGRAILSTWAENARKTTFEYLSEGVTRVHRHLNSNQSHTFTYHFDRYSGGDRITRIEHETCQECAAGVESREYDNQGYLTKRIDVAGIETRYTYYTSGRQWSIIGRERTRTEAYGTPEEKIITTNWNTTFGTVSAISDNGRYTSYWHNNKGQVIQENLGGTITRYTYTPEGRLSRVDGPRTDVLDVTDYTYDTQGNMLSMTNALGHLTTLGNYDPNGRLGQITDPNGVVTSLTYTPRGWLASSTTEGRLTTYYYDDLGQLVEVESPGGIRIRYKYDAAHRLVAIVDDMGNRLEYTLDYRGNRTAEKITDPAGNVLRQQAQRFNAMNQLLEVINGVNQSVVQYRYDVAGRVIEESSAAIDGPRSTHYHYDALGRVRETVDALNAVTSFEYNIHDELIRAEDARGLTTDYTVNTWGEVTQLASPDTGTTTYAYDSVGNRTAQLDARGVRTEYRYDVLNRLIEVHYPSDPLLDVTYTYDENINGIGRLTRIDDAIGHTSYTYDSWGNITSQTQVVSGNTYTLSYGYNADNQLNSITYPSGQVVTYGFDIVGNISDVSTTEGGITSDFATGIHYLPFGPANGWTLGNGLILNRSFDQGYRLTSVATTSVLDYRYAYDQGGNITQWDNLLDNTRSQTFGYDDLDRLIEARGVYGDLSYDYDPVGNRLSKTKIEEGSSTTDTYDYDPNSNGLTGVTSDTYESMNYDAVGNIIMRGGTAYNYNAANRLTGVDESGAQLARYHHNGKGERVIKIASGSTTHFVYDFMGNIVAEADAAGAIRREYVYFNGERLALIDTTTGAIYYYHNDHLATPKLLTDANQNIVWQAKHTPFGKADIQVDQVTNNLRFPGQYFDAETGLHYNYFRDYDPSTGRYLQSDPIGLEGGINTYAYVGGNPLSRIDPRGLAWNPAQVGMTYGEEWDELNSISPAPAACPSLESSECVQHCIRVNYGQFYTVANAFNPVGFVSVGASVYSSATESYATPRVTRGLYTHSSSAHATATRQARALNVLRGANTASMVVASFSFPFVVSANIICEMRCQ